MHDDETCIEVSAVYHTKDEPWLLPGSALKADHGRALALSSGGRRGCLQRGLPDQDILVVPKVYSNEFDSAALEELLKFLALNIGMSYVVDQA